MVVFSEAISTIASLVAVEVGARESRQQVVLHSLASFAQLHCRTSLFMPELLTKFSCFRGWLALVLVAWVGFCESVIAQPEPPTIICTSGDTLRWTYADQRPGCGALESVRIDGAEVRNGSFELLANVPNPPEPFYVLTPEQADRINFVTVAARYGSCGASGPSRVEPTGQLPTPPIDEIDFSPTGTRLSWTAPDNDRRVVGYIVYRETDLGTEPIATVTNTFYVDPLTQVEAGGAIYYISSTDACASSSLISDQYSSVTVAAQRDPCNQSLLLVRQLSAPWPRDFVRAIVSFETDAGDTSSVRVGAATDTLVVPDLDPDIAYTVRVRYEDAEGGATISFPESIAPSAVVAADSIVVAQVTYTGTDWDLQWRWNPDANYTDTRWEVSRGGSVVATGELAPSLASSPAPTVALELGGGVDWTNATVRVIATDACGRERRSGMARPPIVQAAINSAANVDVSWTLPYPSEIDTRSWTLRLLQDVGSIVLDDFAAPGGATEFEHDLASIDERQVCYQLVAEVEHAGVFGRGTEDYTWRSAPVCAQRAARVFLPTGFAPEGGVTSGYRPRTSLIDGFEYSFRVYDRWGTEIFATTDPLETWDGTIRGKDFAPPGTYVALVELEEADASPQRFEALVALIR